ncbi:hypothetical protein [Sulfuracidifex tepidarius]|uniref:Uncharacterized protein n=1 Tax=Sulfuracidifex tepidarius TaxID=1294262 RepID=A0A510E543_9CREN|nr:hypothetical protein [Sulfuracidifex tepidarius]BBG24847.1 hypothetical protein IC006_2181 [Sulfuracidifex tepidarius]BBG27631.1 hypothetical protein IC007_2185 [Sulfuracidifex tepidarius]
MDEMTLKLLPDDVVVNFCMSSKENFVEGETEPIVVGDYLIFIELFPFAVKSKKGVIESTTLRWKELKKAMSSLLSTLPPKFNAS